mmetsp:Transcript_22602/g.31499  ORF Transcript_22602/g.31499 Transcript_22602/m.31499 type:complete len:141 (-) Transcript_22602:71-493(-)|eukprot:CAMPEP_0196579950 /NCGR_PEP_ID=MMETSP1081-20130531/25914_1 /TAXON_ID=36882 /ORGANISM="Pyramimonas amylifera, Strain CCMP720" /LENGTH=140 /DNA_ID=CAMNT_0041899683 /DNA_START=130 /DNA_END=552 /DNA_ORIENTATION=+
MSKIPKAFREYFAKVLDLLFSLPAEIQCRVKHVSMEDKMEEHFMLADVDNDGALNFDEYSVFTQLEHEHWVSYTGADVEYNIALHAEGFVSTQFDGESGVTMKDLKTLNVLADQIVVEMLAGYEPITNKRKSVHLDDLTL